MDRFVPRDDGVGATASQGRGVALEVSLQGTLHCVIEARSAVAIHLVVRQPMDRFVPRDDGVGATASQGRGVALEVSLQGTLHCVIEARSAVAIHACSPRP
jgi:citrate lyase gamma subunit